MRTAVIFRTHKQDAVSNSHLKKLESEVDNFFVVYDATDKPRLNHKKAYNYTVEDARKAGYVIVSPEQISRLPYQKPAGANAFYYNCEYPTVLFCRERPEFDFYLTIEYDVWINGNWKWFLDQLKDNDTDLLATFPRYYPEKVFDGFWDTLNFESNDKCGFFGPVVRYSNRVLTMLDEEYRSGKHGHYELVVPTLTRMHDFSFDNLNVGRSHISTADKKEFYNGITFTGGKNISPFWKEMIKSPQSENMLFHPVNELFYMDSDK